MKLPSARKWNFLFWLVLTLLLVGIYYSQIGPDLFFDSDDNLVIAPMKDIHSVREYYNGFKSGAIYDLQPVRDLITWFDYLILRSFDLSVFHFTNVLIWFFTIAGLKKMTSLKKREDQTWWSCVVLLVAVNPLYVTSISWLSARKHLLAGCFIVWATYQFFAWLNEGGQNKKRIIWLTTFYFLAAFSQPIIVMWPVFVIATLYFCKKLRHWNLFLPLIAIMFLTLACNYFYYGSALYLSRNFGLSKFSESYNDILSIRLFAIGRYVFQVFVPYWTSVAIYAVNSWRGLSGIFLLPIGFYLSLKLTNLKTTILAYGFFLLMLFPVTVKMTQIFGSDTYLISASLGIYFVTASLLHPFLKHRLRASQIVFTCLFTGFTFLSWQRAQAWQDDLSVYAQAYHIEKSVFAGESYISELARRDKLREAAITAQEVLIDYPESVLAQAVITEVIVKDPQFTTRQKIEKIHQLGFSTPIALSGLAELEFKIQDYQMTEQVLLRVLNSNNPWRALRANSETFAALLFISCSELKEKNCDEKVNRVRSIVGGTWDDKKYETEKNRLVSNNGAPGGT